MHKFCQEVINEDKGLKLALIYTSDAHTRPAGYKMTWLTREERIRFGTQGRGDAEETIGK